MQWLVSLFGEPWLLATLLLSVRIATLLLFTPVLHAARMPALVRVAAILGISCVIALPFAHPGVPQVRDVAGLLQAALREAALGAVLGLGVLMAFSGFAVAGRLIDVQLGYGMAQVIDPATQARVPVLSAAFGLFAAVFFFVVDGHHALLRGVAFSIERFPVGQAWSPVGAADPILVHVAALFALGFALAAPVVLGLLLVEFALGVASRNLPQMNMLLMGIPVKIVAGLVALGAWALAFSAPASRLYAGIASSWSQWFVAAGVR